MKQELYSSLLRYTKDELIDDLNQAIMRFPREEVLASTRSSLLSIIEKKYATSYAIFHNVLRDYLHEAQGIHRREMIMFLSRCVPPLDLCNTRDGAIALLQVQSLFLFWKQIFL